MLPPSSLISLNMPTKAFQTFNPPVASSGMAAFFENIDQNIALATHTSDGTDIMTWANGLVQQAALRKQQQAAQAAATAAQQKAQAAATATPGATSAANGGSNLMQMLQNLLSMLMSQLSAGKA